MAEIVYNDTKFRELLLYVASRLAGDPSHGSIKLNKVLFFSDFLHYAAHGVPITGAQYVKHPLGPAPRGLVRIQQDLIDNKDAAMVILQSGAQAQKMLFPLREPDLSLFVGTETAQVERVLADLADHTAKQVSDLSHDFPGWQFARNRHVIPYEAVFLCDAPVTDDHIVEGKDLLERLRPELERVGVVKPAA